jgi:hypothetical protein
MANEKLVKPKHWSDLLVKWQWPTSSCLLQDTWADLNGRLVVDSQQDCLGFRHVQLNDVVKFTFTRRFDTCDPQDYVIEVSSIRSVRRTADKSFVFWYREELPAVQSLQHISLLCRTERRTLCGRGAEAPCSGWRVSMCPAPLTAACSGRNCWRTPVRSPRTHATHGATTSSTARWECLGVTPLTGVACTGCRQRYAQSTTLYRYGPNSYFHVVL